MNLKKDIEKLTNQLETLKSFINADFYNDLNRLKNIVSSLYDASPFKVGDIVKLNKDIEINETTRWGWRGREHFLVKGARAEVKSIDWNYTTNNYAYLLEFEDETYIHFQTKEKIPVKDKGLYYFSINNIDAEED